MKHPHAEVIKAWADGKTIQGRAPGIAWQDFTYNGDNFLIFNKNAEYRIKPEEVVDYTMVVGSGVPCAKFFTEKEKAQIYYVTSLDSHVGFLKRTMLDGKVVKMEFIPK